MEARLTREQGVEGGPDSGGRILRRPAQARWLREQAGAEGAADQGGAAEAERSAGLEARSERGRGRRRQRREGGASEGHESPFASKPPKKVAAVSSSDC